MKLTTGTKAVTAAGTAERLVAVASNVSVRSAVVVAKEGNAGLVYVGNSEVSGSNTPPLNPGDALELGGHDPFNLADVYLDVSVSGEGVDYVAES